MAVPIVDISAFTTSSPSDSSKPRKETAANLINSLSADGYVGITGHGLPPDLVHSAFSMTKKLFALPHDDKRQGSTSTVPGAPPRGFTEAGVEHAGKAFEEKEGKTEEKPTAADYKETFDVGSPSAAVKYPNVWLPEPMLPSFQSFMEDFYTQLNALCYTILDALMLGMGLDDSECAAVKTLHPGLDNQLRLAHYLPFPKQMLDSEEITRLGAHRDWSSFTLLFQSVHAGLEFQNRATGDFVLAPPKEGLLYLNVGDMLERLSNGLLPSSLHRVVVPQALEAEEPASTRIPSRFSIPYFFLPAPDGLVEPLETRVREDGGAKYEALTFREYSERMFVAARGGK